MAQFDFKPAEGSTKQRKRRGRGNASGLGGEAGRGHKGQKSRSGYSYRSGFEGGQTPLYRRLPKKKGQFNPFKLVYSVVNVSQLEDSFNDKDEVTPAILVEKGLVRKNTLVKVLGDGALTKSLTVKADKFSKQAAEKIESAKGSYELLDA